VHFVAGNSQVSPAIRVLFVENSEKNKKNSRLRLAGSAPFLHLGQNQTADCNHEPKKSENFETKS